MHHASCKRVLYSSLEHIYNSQNKDFFSVLGSCKSCNAIVTLLRSPPEIPLTMVPPILLSATFFNPISLITLFTFKIHFLYNKTMFFKMNPNLDPLPKTIILPFLQKVFEKARLCIILLHALPYSRFRILWSCRVTVEKRRIEASLGLSGCEGSGRPAWRRLRTVWWLPSSTRSYCSRLCLWPFPPFYTL